VGEAAAADEAGSGKAGGAQWDDGGRRTWQAATQARPQGTGTYDWRAELCNSRHGGLLFACTAMQFSRLAGRGPAGLRTSSPIKLNCITSQRHDLAEQHPAPNLHSLQPSLF